MKSNIFGIIALVGVLILAILHFTDRRSSSQKTPVRTVAPASGAGLRIAFVDIDTFEANYDVLKKKRAEFEKKQAAAEAELQRSAQQYQNTLAELQKKGQTMTETEGRAAEKQLMQMQESLNLRQESLRNEIEKEQKTFNTQLQSDIDSFLAVYNRDAKFDYIMSYSAAINTILYANPALDVTQDVIKGMNALSAGKSEPRK
jgi:outer membrane protein